VWPCRLSILGDGLGEREGGKKEGERGTFLPIPLTLEGGGRQLFKGFPYFAFNFLMPSFSNGGGGGGG